MFATSKQDVCIILRNDNGEVYYKKEITLSPEHVLTETVDVKGARFNQLTFDIVKTCGTTSCLALALLNDEGIVAGCEGDMQTLLSMFLASTAMPHGVLSTTTRRHCAATPTTFVV